MKSPCDLVKINPFGPLQQFVFKNMPGAKVGNKTVHVKGALYEKKTSIPLLTEENPD